MFPFPKFLGIADSPLSVHHRLWKSKRLPPDFCSFTLSFCVHGPPEFLLPTLHAYAACIDLDLKLMSPHSTKISSHTMQQMHLLPKKKGKKETKESQVIQFPLNPLGRGHPHPISLLPANCPPTLNQKMYQFIFLKKRISPQR